MSNLSIHARLTVAFAVLGVMLLLQAALAHFSNSLYAKDTQLIIDAHEASEELMRLTIEGQKMQRFEKEFFIHLDEPVVRQGYADRWFDSHNQVRDGIARIRATPSTAWTEADLARLAGWADGLGGYERAFTRVDLQITEGGLNDIRAANATMADADAEFQAFVDGAFAQVGRKYARAQELAALAASHKTTMQYALYAITALGLGLALTMIFYVPAMIAKPLIALTHAANEMSKGKVRDDLPLDGPPEVRDLAESMDRLRVALRGILQRLQSQKARTGGGPASSVAGSRTLAPRGANSLHGRSRGVAE